MKKSLLIFLLFLSAGWYANAQNTVSGKVTSSEDSEGIPGVNIMIKGAGTGTTTDIEGNYKLEVPDASTIVVSYVGYQTQEIAIGTRSTIDISMIPDDKQLDEVVITALGVSREKASLGYSQQSVDGEALNQAKTDNILESLSGKIAGVNVRQASTMGGGAVINIRGNSSVVDNNPLFIIDGVPIQNTTRNTVQQQNGQRGYDYGNPVSDLNPDDIETMEVLKGAAATALYGARGQNGVVLVTTKKGRAGQKGIGVEVGFGMSYGTIDKSTFAEYQMEYGAGYFGAESEIIMRDVNGDGVPDATIPTGDDGSYGAHLDGRHTAYQWDSFVPGEVNFGQAYPYVAPSSTPVDFFESQITTNTNVALSGANETSSFRLSYTNNTTDDVLPNSSLNKNTLNFTGATKLSDKLSTDVMFQYSQHDLVGGYSSGYGDNIMSQFRQWWAVNVDIDQQRRVYERTGLNYTWNAGDITDPLTPLYFDNPYWTRYENYNSQFRDRVLSKVGIKYDLTNWLSFNGRASIDSYNEIREERRAKGSIATRFGVAAADVDAGYARTEINSKEWNYYGSLNINKDLTDDLSLGGFVGFNLQKERYENNFSSTSGGLVVEDIYALSNSKGVSPYPIETLYEKEVYGYFSNASLGYNDFLYLDGNFRIDVSSALPRENRQYAYGGISSSFVLSELIDVTGLDFAKLRASYGSVGNDTRALRVIDTYEREVNFASANIYSNRMTKNNPDLKPERTVEYEFGAEGSFLGNRLSVDLSYYNRETEDQLMPIAVSAATGYTQNFRNIGTVRNRGIEVALNGSVIEARDFKYGLGINYTRNRNKVLELGGEIQNYVIRDLQGDISSNATVGQPLGVMRGPAYTYHEESGERLVSPEGYYVATMNQVIGDPNPDFTVGFNNTISYKGLTLNFLIDWSQGGDIYSLDMHYGRGTGLYPETVGNNDLGNPIRNPLTTDNTSGGIILPGVQADGTPNTVRAAADYYGGVFYWGNDSRNPGEATMYDASYVKLREARLTYSLSGSLLGSWSQGIDLSLYGRNLWIIHKNVPYADPESGLGGQFNAGYLSGSYPTVRSYGFDVRFKF